MATPDILESVGFQKSKIGSGDKEVGYVIKKSNLGFLSCGVVTFMSLMVVGGVLTFFDIRFEKRSLHRKLRTEEHHAASKLASVEMELWSHYHEDIEESKEAMHLVRNLNKSYIEFQGNLQDSVKEFASELHLKDDMAASVADRILRLVAELQQNNSKNSQHLVGHLIQSGRKAAPLEKNAHKKALEEVKEEAERDEGDESAGDAIHPDEDDEKENPLKDMLEGFWATFKDYEREFSGKVREALSEPGNKVYQQIKALRDRMATEEGLSEEDVMKGLDAIDLTSVGAGLGEGRVLPAHDIVEELYVVPKIPHAKLESLEKDWRSGKKETDVVFRALIELESQELIPSGWMQQGVDREEEGDERDEEREEKEEEDDEDPDKGNGKKKATV